MFYGRGAGAEPTASAVVSDIVDIVVSKDTPKKIFWERADESEVYDYSEYAYSRYISVPASEKDALMNSGIGVKQVMADSDEIAVITEPVSDKDMSAIAEKCSLNILADICVL
jgi:hypothetical protein